MEKIKMARGNAPKDQGWLGPAQPSSAWLIGWLGYDLAQKTKGQFGGAALHLLAQ
jgi:hypothetical protein